MSGPKPERSDPKPERSDAPLPPGDPRHGTSGGYGNHKCRCEECRTANAAHHAAYMERVRAEGRSVGRHGSDLRYDTGCRCDPCRLAHNARSRDYKRRRRASVLSTPQS